MSDIGELVVRIKADAAQLERELRKATLTTETAATRMSRSLKELHAQFKGLLPAFAIGTLAAFGATAFREADRINDLAQRTGFLGSTLSALNIPLKQGGSSLEEFASSMNRMNNLVGEAAKGLNQEAVRAFDDLGLSVRKLQALSPEEQFYEIARALSEQTTQAAQTNLGMAIFGRSFATLLPLIKQAGGDMKTFTDEIKRNGDSLTDEDLKRIDEFGDKWTEAVERLKLAMANAMPGLKLYLDGLAGILNLPSNAFQAGGDLARAAGVASNPNVSSTRPTTVSEATQVSGYTFDAKGNLVKGGDASAKGSNAGLLKPSSEQKALETAKKSLKDYNTELQRQNEILKLTPREQAAVIEMYKTRDLAEKAGIKNSAELEAANMNLARSNYDLNESMQESARFMQELKDRSTSALTDIAFEFDSASESALRFAETIARIAFEKKIAGPLVDSLFGSGGNPGMMDGLLSGAGDFFGGFFADGGRPPVGKASIVGENGPEIFVPDSAGTVIPNGRMGGTQVIVQQTINMSPGLPETVNAAIMRAAPAIASQAQAAVFQAIERGGSEARLVGRRS